MTEKRYFIVDVEETHQENAVWQYDDKLDDYDFVCFEDDSDKLVMKLNELAEFNVELMEKNKELKKESYGNLDGLETYKALYSDLSEKYDNLEADFDDLRKEIEQLKKEYNSLQGTAYKIDSIAYDDREYSERLSKQNQQLEKENKELKSINQDHQDHILLLEEEKINLQIKLQKIRDYAMENGEVKQDVIEKVVFE